MSMDEYRANASYFPIREDQAAAWAELTAIERPDRMRAHREALSALRKMNLKPRARAKELENKLKECIVAPWTCPFNRHSPCYTSCAFFERAWLESYASLGDSDLFDLRGFCCGFEP